MRLAVAIACVTLGLIACSSPSPPPTPTPLNVPPEATSAVDAARQAAATQLGVNPDQLQVTEVQAQQWPDASLGCPQPGQLYSQVVTPGYIVMITNRGRQFEYHTDSRSHATLCHES